MRAAALTAASIWAGAGRAAAAPAPAVEDFKLVDQEGLPRQLYRITSAKAVVLVSHAHGCSALARRAPALKALRERYEPKGAILWLLDPAGPESRARVAEDAAALGLGAPILLDDAQFVSSGLKLTRCAESVVISTDGWVTRYRGSIDGLEAALAGVLAGKPVGAEGPASDGEPLAYAKAPIGWAKDVAPILANRCATCHFPLGQAPALTSYEAAASWAPTIREAVRTRRMPPWPVDAWYRPLAGDVSLTAAEKRSLVQWIEAGAPKAAGEPDPLVEREQAPEWPLGAPDLVWQMSKDYVYSANDFRVSPIEYVELGPAVDEDLWLSAIAVQSRNPAVKQHVNVLALPTTLEEYNRTHDKLHFSGQEMLNWFDFNVFVTVRAPDERVPPVLPEGVAYHIPKGSHIVLELHYQSSGAEQRDRLKLGFYRYKGKAAPKPLRMKLVGLGEKLSVPAGASDFRAQAWGRTRTPITVLGFYPHMHLRGLWMKAITKAPDGPEEILLSSPDYNFFWASWYRFQEPKKLAPGSWIYVRGAFDNTAANPANPDPAAEGRFGVRLIDEMFAVRMFYVDD